MRPAFGAGGMVLLLFALWQVGCLVAGASGLASFEASPFLSWLRSCGLQFGQALRVLGAGASLPF